MVIKRILAASAVTMVAAVGAGSAFLTGAGSALAPEPAQLGASNLPSTNGSTVAATYVNSTTPTKVVNWPSSLVSKNSYYPATVTAGQPCYPGYLAPYRQTTKVIRVYGTYAWCA